MTPPRLQASPLRGAAVLLSSLMLAALAACSQEAPPSPVIRIGDSAQGKIVMTRSGCGSCHEIPGLMHANGLVGPPLQHFAGRTIIAGLLPNTPQNLVKWIRYPQEVVPGNAMPDAGLDDRQARDIAAYLYTLR